MAAEKLDSPYFLQSERLGFRHWSESDNALAMGLWGDGEVTHLIGGPFSAEQVSARLLKEINSQRDHAIQYWPIFLRTTGEHVGCCGLRPYDPNKRIYEIGFHLRKTFWGQGYATEAAKAVMRYAFTMLDAQALFAGHHPDNQASRQLLTRLGFRYTRDEYYAPTGRNHPSYLLTKADFEATEQPQT